MHPFLATFKSREMFCFPQPKKFLPLKAEDAKLATVRRKHRQDGEELLRPEGFVVKK